LWGGVGAQPGAAATVAHRQTTCVEQTVGGCYGYGADVERGGELADGRKLLVVLGRPRLALDGVSDIGRRRPAY